MRSSNSVIAWSMRNFRITFLIVGCLFVFGIYALARIPKQEFPEYTIRQGVVVGVYPGATAEEVEEQLAKPLEQFLMTYKEVKRAKTTSTSQNGMCYVMVELNDDVNDKDEVWSKVKHGLAAFKMQLPAGVAAVVTNDDFGDTSALLITLESDTRSYRELKGYMDDLSDRLRRIESVSNLRPYGVQQEQISVYADPERLAAYGIGEKTLSAALAAQGLIPLGGSVSNAETETPIHIAPSLAGEREVAEQIVWSDPEGHVLRVKDVARVVREYDDPDSYIRNNGHRCVLLSLEMQAGNNIVEYGREVDEVLHAFIEEELPADVSVQRIADQAKVVGDSVHSFLRDLFVAMAIIIVVMMLLFPLRSAIVAALTIPMSTFISVGMMYLCGIPLNTVTLAALVVVLGMIVDNSIVVIDGYLDYLGRGHSRWFAAVESAREFFPSLLLATICICMIFYPILFTMTGMMGDFLTWFPWTITINLMVSLLLAVMVIPFLEILIIPAVHVRRDGRRSFTDRVHDVYRRVLAWTFRHGWLTISLGAASVVVSLLIATQLKFRMVPFADRDQFAVEIYLRPDTPLERTGAVADSVYRALRADERVKSVTSFVGCSSPRFQMSYAPQIAGKNYAQFIVNTTSVGDTEAILDEYADAWADRFPEAYVKFKQLDYQNVPSLEFRFYGSDIDSLRAAADRLMARMRQMPELQWVHTDYEDPRAIAEVRLDPVTASQLGITRTVVAANMALASGDVAVGSVWEGDYRLPVVLKRDARLGERSLSDIGDTYVSSPVPGVSVPLRQIADVEPAWSQSKIVHRNGMRCITVTADLKRGANAMRMTSRISRMLKDEIPLPPGVETELGGAHEFDAETLPPIAAGLSISLVIIFFFILVNFRKFGITLVVMASMSLCLFGAMVGLWIADFTIGLTSVLGFITLLGMIVRNVILMYQHAEDKRKVCHWSGKLAAYDAGKRRMVPIFLTTATTAVGVVPMMLGGSTFWAPVGVTIFAGGIGSLILVVTILPVLYSKIYK
ncbi:MULTISPECIES: efflux RND transporter permease subunit [Alistipes]|uniref:efflux RND transporter permease subunit n=1 Tax=Alistipes TaxID=239759 RepID=UPI0009690C4C|nr:MULTISPECIES: efflux RND transporter permease subunit [Alistipes]MBV4294664.1 efflux RND transporter permease subunit [Alistipes shahii]OKY83503.1 MAG: acriflavine resistance protein B [Alistipes sp. 56_sp_Nov_56_25]